MTKCKVVVVTVGKARKARLLKQDDDGPWQIVDEVGIGQIGAMHKLAKALERV